LEPVRDLAFSPNLGRSYHMLAVASKDVHIFSLKPLTRFSTFCVSIVKTIDHTGWSKLIVLWHGEQLPLPSFSLSENFLRQKFFVASLIDRQHIFTI